MLSTPIARIKKGTTSAEIIDNPFPNNDMIPIDEPTAKKTRIIPNVATKNPPYTIDGKDPIASAIYMNIKE